MGCEVGCFEGRPLGCLDGLSVGCDEGRPEGCIEGWLDGFRVGCRVGCLEGWPVGCDEGLPVGFPMGCEVGCLEGRPLGCPVGRPVGCREGRPEGCIEGWLDGWPVGSPNKLLDERIRRNITYFIMRIKECGTLLLALPVWLVSCGPHQAQNQIKTCSGSLSRILGSPPLFRPQSRLTTTANDRANTHTAIYRG